MASSKKASISAELRADRTKFKADLDAAKRDSKTFSTEVRREFAVASDITLAAKMKELRGETLKAKDDVKVLAAEYVKLKTAHSGIKPVQMQVSGLKLRPDSAAAQAQSFTDPAFVDRTRASVDGLTRSTITANTEMMKSGKGATNAGMGMLFLAQGVDDAQYGFRSIVNNVAPLVMALGGGPGLAGALTIAAVGFNLLGDAASKSWNSMTGEEAYQKLLEQNAAMEEMHNRKLERLRIEARQAGEMKAEGSQSYAESEGRWQAKEQERLALSLQMRDVEQQIARAKLESSEAAGKDVALLEMGKKHAAEKLATEKQFYDEKMGNLKNRMGMDNYGRSSAQRGLGKLEQEQRDFELQPDDSISERERRRKEELPGLITAARIDVDREQTEYHGLQASQRDVAGREKLHGKGNKLKDQEFANEQYKKGEEMAKQGLGAVVQFFENVATHAKEANEADEKAWKAQKEKAAAEQMRADEKIRLEIETLRAGGKDKQANALQKSADLDATARDLMGKGFKPEEAEDMAAQSQRNAELMGKRGGGDPNRKRIKGAVSSNLKTGLDGEWQTGSKDFFQHGIGYNSDQQKTPLNNQRGAVSRNLRAAEATGGAGSSEAAALRDLKDALTAKLDQLINVSTGTAGARTKPAATRN